jgi:signal transduction histidine kinase
MTVDQLLTELTRIFFILLTVITTIDYLRHRDEVRRDVALVFLCLSASNIIRLLMIITGIQGDWLTRIGSLALIAQPFLLFRLVGYFRPVPTFIYRVGLAGMVASWGMVIFLGTPLPVPASLAIVAYFALIDGYAVMAFIRAAFSSAGVTRNRLRFAAAGSALLILALVFAGIRVALPDLFPVLFPYIQLFAMLSALAYYLGFAPPRWLRQAWQLGELRTYLRRVQKIGGDSPKSEILAELYDAVSRAMGTPAVVKVLWDEESEKLVLHKSSHSPTSTDLYFEGVVQRAWRERTPLVVQRKDGLDPQDVRLLESFRAGTLLLVPIATSERALGVLLVFLEYGSLFVEDDLDLLNIFAQQTAFILENNVMLEELQRHTEDLEAKVQERTVALQRSNEDLRRFAYIASHDLQEPLRTVSSYLQLVESRYSDKLDDDGQEFINFAVEGAARMKDLIDDILTYSRVEAQPGNFTLIDSGKVLDKTRQLLEVSINETKATITNDPLPQIKADEQLITQLFQNLIGNAIKYRSEKHPEIHVRANCENGEWVFSVRDNGIGIDSQYRERIFVLFQRLHNRSQYPGTGIGLAVCKKAVEQHGGRIWVESEVGKGSTFYFTIPT